MANRPLSANRREVGFLILGWLVIAILVVALSKQNLSTPGLYYDEAVSGGLAKDFITGHAQPHMSNVQLLNISGRPFPLFVQSYYGALKSWLLIPPIAVWGRDARRFTSYEFGLCTGRAAFLRASCQALARFACRDRCRRTARC